MVDRVVLDIELTQTEAIGEPRAADERREPPVKAGLRLAGDRQQLTVAPHVLWPPVDVLPGQPHRRVVVDRLERPETLLADVGRFGGKGRLAQMALQSDERAHTASL